MNTLRRNKMFTTALALLVVGVFWFNWNSNAVSEEPTPTPVPPFLQKHTFGQSVAGRAIEGYEIGRGTEVILMLGSIHGNEMGTTDLLTQLIEEVIASPSLVSKNKKLVVIPMANPDGFIDRIDKSNANGVNLNLNFPTAKWEHYGSGGTYAGPEPFSEPESRIIRDVVERYQPAALIAFHARGALVSPELSDVSKKLSSWYAAKSGYDYYDEWDYFGTATRWFEETTGRPSTTVELTKYLESDWRINQPALMELIGGLKISEL